MILTIDDPDYPHEGIQNLDNEGLDGVLRVRLTLVGTAAYSQSVKVQSKDRYTRWSAQLTSKLDGVAPLIADPPPLKLHE